MVRGTLRNTSGRGICGKRINSASILDTGQFHARDCQDHFTFTR
jgi:hypothetical protein